MWIKRTIEPFLVQMAQQRPALIVTGSRQSGKTSLLRKVFPDANYVSLDVPATAEYAEESGSQFLNAHPTPLIIDEAQYAPKLFRYLKAQIDQRREESGRYFITGSQKFSLMQGVTESLAGRVSVITCHSLSAAELEGGLGKTAEGDQLVEWIFLGGYPELHARQLNAQRFFEDYLVTYLERDLRQLLNVKNLRDFDRFLRLAALRTGQLFSLNSLASDVGVSPNTIKSWVSVLEASNIIYLLQPYHTNLGKRLVKTPKLYFLDTGLACHLTGLQSSQALLKSNLLGPMFETFVLGQILRHYVNQGLPENLYFYRDHHGHEVDFVIPRGEKLKLVECKWSEHPSQHHKGFAEIEKLMGTGNLAGKSIIVPTRGHREITSQGLWIEDCVDLVSFD